MTNIHWDALPQHRCDLMNDSIWIARHVWREKEEWALILQGELGTPTVIAIAFCPNCGKDLRPLLGTPLKAM